jgi:hypothetical protein
MRVRRHGGLAQEGHGELEQGWRKPVFGPLRARQSLSDTGELPVRGVLKSPLGLLFVLCLFCHSINRLNTVA